MSNLLQMISKSSILAFGDNLLDGVKSVVGTILWGLCDIFFILLDLFEGLFKRLAGVTQNVTTKTGEVIEGDLVLYLIQSDVVQQVFMSIFVLSLFLLIIFTIFAIVKNQYAEKQDPVSKIINNSFKALLMYLLVPVATIVCLIVGNVVLQAIDGATKAHTNGGVSDMLFMSGAYNANKLRDGELDDMRATLRDLIADGYLDSDYMIAELAKLGINSSTDAAFASEETIDYIATLIDEEFVNSNLDKDITWKWRAGHVSKYYDVFQISLIIIWAGGAFLIWSIGKICWGLVSRLFKMTYYFAISPIIMATFPIDGGKALGSWRGEMVKLGTLAYSSIAVLNVLYSILPFFDTNINLYGMGAINSTTLAVSTPGSFIANQLLKIFIYIVAFSGANSLIDAIGGWFGLGNIVNEGKSTKSAVTGQLKKYAEKGMAIKSGAFAGMKAAEEHGGNKWSGFITGALGGAGLKHPVSKLKDAREKGEKAGEGLYKDKRTTNWLLGSTIDDKKKAYEQFDTVNAINKQYKALGGGKGSYDPAKDDGTNAEQEIFRNFLLSTEYGKAFNKKKFDEHAHEEAEAKNEQKYNEILKRVVDAEKAKTKAETSKAKAEAKLKSEFDALIGTPSWDNLTEDQRMDSINAMLRGDPVWASTLAGQSTDLLQSLLESYSSASDAVTDASDILSKTEESIKKRIGHDNKFKAYANKAGNGVTFDNAGNITGFNSADIKKQTDDIEAKLIDVEEKVEKLKKETAEQAQNAYQNGIESLPDADKRKKELKNYKDSQPKS